MAALSALATLSLYHSTNKGCQVLRAAVPDLTGRGEM